MLVVTIHMENEKIRTTTIGTSRRARLYVSIIGVTLIII